jgi:hypothetical protein
MIGVSGQPPEILVGEPSFGEWRRRRFDIGDVSKWTTELRHAYREKRAPALPFDDLRRWIAACDLLFLTEKLDALDYAGRYLYAACPDLPYARTLCEFLDRIPPDDGSILPFHNEVTREAQVVRRDGAAAVIFVFCDTARMLGMPLPAVHRWLGRLPASVVYLRDFRRGFCLDGIRSLGDTRIATVEALRDLASSLGARRIFCIGNSSGAYAALLFGIELYAEATLALAALINLSPDFNNQNTAWWRKILPETSVDLRQAYAAADHPPRTLIVHSRDNRDDLRHAECLGGSPGVALYPVEGYAGHNLVVELVRRDEFTKLLDWLMT